MAHASRPNLPSVQFGVLDVRAPFGLYELLESCGGGALHTIHRARSRAPGASRLVAIKRLRAGRHNANARARLLREARLGLEMRAANLVRILELHDVPEPFMVMEYVEGSSLYELMGNHLGVDALRYVLPMFVDVLYGLSALHSYRSPEGAPSFLVHQAPTIRHMLAGQDGVTRLIDLSHVYGPLLPPVPRSPVPAEVAFAPEQFHANGPLDPRCDIFLVGVALHEVLTRLGAVPRDPVGHSLVEADWAALHAIAGRARAPRRSDRFWSAEEMAYALRSFAIGAGLFAPRVGVGAWVRGQCLAAARDATLSAEADSWADTAATAPWRPLQKLEAAQRLASRLVSDGTPRAMAGSPAKSDPRGARSAKVPIASDATQIIGGALPRRGSRGLLLVSAVAAVVVTLTLGARGLSRPDTASASRPQMRAEGRSQDLRRSTPSAPAAKPLGPAQAMQVESLSPPRKAKARVRHIPAGPPDAATPTLKAVDKNRPRTSRVGSATSELPQNPY